MLSTPHLPAREPDVYGESWVDRLASRVAAFLIAAMIVLVLVQIFDTAPTQETQMITLGDTARDTITGFTGVVIADTKWLHGCRRLTLQPRELKDGKPVESMTFDEPQLVKVETTPAEASSAAGGGPRPEPVRR